MWVRKIKARSGKETKEKNKKQLTDIPTNTLSTPSTKVQFENVVHLLQVRLGTFHPPFGLELVRVGEHLWVPVRHPRVDTDDGPTGDEVAVDVDALGGHVSFHQ